MTRNRNHGRADHAAIALSSFTRETGVDMGRDAVHDLIADLGHYCVRQRLDFLGIVSDAVSCWAAERADPRDDNIRPGPRVSILISEPVGFLRHALTNHPCRAGKAGAA